MGAAIGASMRALGIHQGLAPVLDVVRDPRWGRVEECISEDPYLVGTIGTSYVRGPAVGRRARHAQALRRLLRPRRPAATSPRCTPARASWPTCCCCPFEMAVLDGGARSVMHSYAEIDGVPVAADPSLLTGLLRDRWGFDGTVVADYFGVAFLHLLHDVAGDLGEAAALALAAGVDIELPTGDAYLEPLAEAVRARRGRRGARRPGGAARAAPEGGARAARRDLRRRARRATIDLDAPDAPRARRPAGRGVGRAARQRRRSCR